MLEHGRVATRLPAQDLARGRAFYSDRLGLEPVEERPGGLLYHCADGEFALFESEGAPSGSHTQMAWEVDDIESVVAHLKARGVVFEEYDLPGLTTIDGIAEVTTIRARAVSASAPPGSETARAICSRSASRSKPTDNPGVVTAMWWTPSPFSARKRA